MQAIENGSFYITLASNALDIFRRIPNKPNFFINSMESPLDLSNEWEVGLKSITFPSIDKDQMRSKRATREPPIVEIPPFVLPLVFFTLIDTRGTNLKEQTNPDASFDSGTVEITSNVEHQIIIEGGIHTPRSFIESINRAIDDYLKMVGFAKNWRKFWIEIDDDTFELTLHSKLKLMGDQYGHEYQFAFSLGGIINGVQNPFGITRDKFLGSRPYLYEELFELAAERNDETFEYQFGLQKDEQLWVTRVKSEIVSKGKLSSQLFGIPPGEIISPVPAPYDESEENRIYPLNPDPSKAGVKSSASVGHPKVDSLFDVHCNIIRPSLHGTKEHRVLRTVSANLDSDKAVHTVQFSPVYYFPLNRDVIDAIQIEIYDTRGKLYPFDKDDRVTLRLHFRKRKINGGRRESLRNSSFEQWSSKVLHRPGKAN